MSSPSLVPLPDLARPVEPTMLGLSLKTAVISAVFTAASGLRGPKKQRPFRVPRQVALTR